MSEDEVKYDDKMKAAAATITPAMLRELAYDLERGVVDQDGAQGWLIESCFPAPVFQLGSDAEIAEQIRTVFEWVEMAKAAIGHDPGSPDGDRAIMSPKTNPEILREVRAAIRRGDTVTWTLSEDRRVLRLDVIPVDHFPQSAARPSVPDTEPSNRFTNAEISAMSTDDLRVAVRTLDALVEGRDQLLAAIPECSLHGNCIPHAIEWVEGAKADLGTLSELLADKASSAPAAPRHCRETLVQTLVHHQQRASDSGCHCGWGKLGHSWPEHVANEYEGAMAASGPSPQNLTAAFDELAKAAGGRWDDVNPDEYVKGLRG